MKPRKGVSRSGGGGDLEAAATVTPAGGFCEVAWRLSCLRILLERVGGADTILIMSQRRCVVRSVRTAAHPKVDAVRKRGVRCVTYQWYTGGVVERKSMRFFVDRSLRAR